jgi:hypothetical protein
MSFILQNLNLFNGYLIGFGVMWLIPRKWFDFVAI